VVIIPLLFPLYLLITRFLTRVKRLVSLVEQGLLTYQDHLSSPWFFGVCVCVCVCHFIVFAASLVPFHPFWLYTYYWSCIIESLCFRCLVVISFCISFEFMSISDFDGFFFISKYLYWQCISVYCFIINGYLVILHRIMFPCHHYNKSHDTHYCQWYHSSYPGFHYN